MARLDTLKAGNKKPKRSPAQIKTLKTWAKKKGISVARLQPYLYGNKAGKEPSEVMKALMNKLKIGDELDSSGMGTSRNVSDRH
tara:strand:+ start:955 stop:1206 length:252 start_codon:yes stop_codon:yes gene_type:complete